MQLIPLQLKQQEIGLLNLKSIQSGDSIIINWYDKWKRHHVGFYIVFIESGIISPTIGITLFKLLVHYVNPVLGPCCVCSIHLILNILSMYMPKLVSCLTVAILAF